MMARFAWIAPAPTRWPSWSRLKDEYQVAFGNDPDSDRHGIVTPSAGLMNPNHYLAVAIDYLFSHRPKWPRRPRWARRWSAAASSIAWRRHCRVRLSKCRSASNGSSTDCSTAPWVSAGKKARVLVSCGLTVRSGRPTRTGSSWACWPPRSRRSPVRIPGEHFRDIARAVRHALLHAHRRSRRHRTERVC